MLRKSFGDFLNRKKREAIKQLGLVGQMLEQGGMKVENFLEDDSLDDPYIYCHNPKKSASFDGIRIYKIGNQIAFRIQKENKTHPYGKAYPLNIEEMFHDLLGDEETPDEQTTSQKVVEFVVKEIKKFFERSAKAEKEEKRQTELGGDSQGDVIIRGTGTDYSSLIFNKGN